MATAKTRGAGRTRSWTFVLYPESAPADWRDELDQKHIAWIESPLHDKDFDVDGVIKKPHWHILLLFDSVKDFHQVEEITKSLNAPIPQKAASAKALVRYMAHLDNPDKYQYDKGLIIGHGGADVADLLRPSASDRYVLISEMLDYVEECDVTEFCDLMDFARRNRFEDWFPLLCDNSAYVVSQHIKSKRYKLDRQK